ncbi:MAG TPA: hypothetical protein VKI65_03745, partial [Gemmataceae bacterium]|nr:hypothetical protein [Gemmataceae bacterium]
MFDWLFEGLSAVYLLLATAAVILLVVWWRTRRRKYAVVIGVIAALAGAYYLLDIAVETDREQIQRKVQELAAGVHEHRLERTFAQVSDSFRRRGRTKEAFRQAADQVIGRVREVRVWNVDVTS